jgi:ParB family chromosome partitioning protein
MTSETQEIPLSQINEPANPMRTDLDMDSIKELAASIATLGLLQAIVVRPVADRFEVVAGHRRLKAHQILGRETIKAVVRVMTDDELSEIMAAENLEREDIDPVDQALFIGRLMQLPDATIQGIAKRLNRSAPWVSDRLNILEYPEYLVVAIKLGKIKLGVAKWLGQIEDDAYRKMFVESAVRNGMSNLQAEYAYRQYEVGVMPSLDDIAAAGEALRTDEPVKMRALCARCGNNAFEPNLHMVWTHVDCDRDSNVEPAVSVVPTTSSTATA